MCLLSVELCNPKVLCSSACIVSQLPGETAAARERS